MVKNLPANAGDVRNVVSSLGWEDSPEKEMAICSSILACEIQWTEEPGRLQSMGLQNRHDLATKTTNKNNNQYLLLNTEYNNLYLLPNTLKYNFFILIHLILHKISA